MLSIMAEFSDFSIYFHSLSCYFMLGRRLKLRIFLRKLNSGITLLEEFLKKVKCRAFMSGF